MIVLNPFLDSLGNFALKNIGLPPGAGSGCFQSSQDAVVCRTVFPADWRTYESTLVCQEKEVFSFKLTRSSLPQRKSHSKNWPESLHDPSLCSVTGCPIINLDSDFFFSGFFYLKGYFSHNKKASFRFLKMNGKAEFTIGL